MPSPDIRHSLDTHLPVAMRAATYDRYGAPEEVITIATLPVPAPREGEVLVKVAAASVNAADWHYTTGLPMFARASLGLRRPARSVAGTDVSGTVVAVGPGVTRFSAGDAVCGQVAAGGSFAEYVAVPAHHLAGAPSRIPLTHAATLGIAAETALQSLRDWAGLQPHQSVLINGASGGVGTFAVQIAKALGAGHVTAVCSTANVETARRLGADTVIDYTREDVTARPDRYDVVLDNAGVWPLRTCRRLLARGGVYVSITSPKSRWLKPLPRMIATPLYFAATGGRTVAGKVASRSTPDLEALVDLVDRGLVTPVVERTFPLAEAGRALAVQGEFHARGKSIIVI